MSRGGPVLFTALVLAACASTSAKHAPDVTTTVERTGALPNVSVVVDDVEVAPYRGAHRHDPRLAGMFTRVVDACREAASAVRADLDVHYPTGRGPLVRVEDDAPVPAPEPTRVLVDGIRRPVIRIRTSALLTGAFAPEERMRPLLVHVALLVAAGERLPPAWVLTGGAVELGGAFERLLVERAVRGAYAFADERALFSQAMPELVAAARVRALRRIAKGERPVLRYLDAWRRTRSEGAALDELGISDPLFLEAAAETEQARSFEALDEDPLYASLAAARAALAAGDANAADAALTGVLSVAAPERTPRLWADVGLVRAEIAWSRREILGADAETERLLATPETLVRLEDALWLRARVDRERGRDAQWFGGLATLLEAFPDRATARAVLEEVGSGALAADEGVVGDLVNDAVEERARRAGLLAELAGRESVGILRVMTHDAHPLVRSSALTALVLQSGAAAVRDLVAGTDDVDPSVRRAALLLLESADPKLARERATALRGDPDVEVRAEAVRILEPPAKPGATQTGKTTGKKPAAEPSPGSDADPEAQPRPGDRATPPPRPKR